jgi:hypothetical protein
MRTASQYVKVHYTDKIVFTQSKRAKREGDVLDVWRRSQGIWKDHPVFRSMTTKEVIEWLRGEDSDV